MLHRQELRARQLANEGFPFEGGAVQLPDGSVFVPDLDAVDRWVSWVPSKWSALGPTFDILYLLDGGKFVLVNYQDDAFAASAVRVSWWSQEKALEWLINGNFPLPDSLQSKVRPATSTPSLSTILGRPDMIERIQKLLPVFQPTRKDDVGLFRVLLSRYYGISRERVAELTVGQIQIALDSFLDDEDSDGIKPGEATDTDRYQWARQSELWRATNQVLGEAVLDKGVISRACNAGGIDTNGRSGRGCMVRVSSFITWMIKRNELGRDEASQIRNAIIGEISTRNS